MLSGSGAGVNDIATGPDGNLWFTEVIANRVGKITANLATTSEFRSGITAGAAPAFITVGPDGDLWFTESGLTPGQIGRISTTGQVNEFPLPAGVDPEGMAAGPSGTLWFTENGSDRIGRILAAAPNTVTEFLVLPAGPGAAPQDITMGPDGNLWFAEGGLDRIGRITPAGVVTEYSMGITASSGPFGITTGPDGNLWFTEANSNVVGRLIPDAPLVAAGVPVSGTATLSFAGPVATFADGDPTSAIGDFSVTINWGEGTPLDTTTGTVGASVNGMFSVSGTHTYATAGSNTITVTIVDNNTTTAVGGSTATANSAATVARAQTTTALTASAAGGPVGQPLRFTATVTASAGGAHPTGTVTFLDGTTTLGTMLLNASGQAILTTVLAVGSHTITAEYSVTRALDDSTSPALAESINPNVTSELGISLGKPRQVGAGRFRRRVTLRVLNANLVPGPLFLVVDNLPAKVKLRGATSSTRVLSSLGSLFVVLDLGGASAFGPGGVVTMDLEFRTTSAAGIKRIVLRVLAGTTLI